jgi:hypothetical protein
VSRGTLDTGLSLVFSLTGLLPSLVRFSIPSSAKTQESLCQSTTPIYLSISVWAPPRSLATTYGITFVFYSCGYLDVSVPHVSLHYAMYSHNDNLHSPVN